MPKKSSKQMSSSSSSPPLAPSVPLATSPSSLSLADMMCNIYLDDLLVKFKDIEPPNPCPYCKYPVMHHNRKPSFSPPSPSPSSSVRSGGSLLQQLTAKPRISFDKVIRELPKWTKQSVCRTYLQRITQIMQTSGIDQKEWMHVFPVVVEEVSASCCSLQH